MAKTKLEQLPLFKLVIDTDAKADGMDYMGLVDYPAHGKNWLAFGKQKEIPIQKEEFKQHFNEDKRIVTGVAIATNLQIYRKRKDGTEYNVFFTKEDTLEIAQELFKNGYMHNVNEMHDLNKDVSDIYLFESFFVNEDKSNIPAAFEDQNLQAGTWIVSYKVENDEVWEKIKEGEFVGFSIEGWFKEVEVNIKKTEMKAFTILKGTFATIQEITKWDLDVMEDDITIGTELHYKWVDMDGAVQEGGRIADGEYMWDGHKIQVDSSGVVVMIDGQTEEVELKSKKMKKKDTEAKKPTLFERLWGKKKDEEKEPIKFDSENKDKYATATTVDGTEVFWEGELAVGEPLFVVVEGEEEPVLSSDDVFSWEIDGTLMVISTDEAGLITDISEAEEEEQSEDGDDDEVFEAMQAMKTQMEGIKEENDKLKEQLQETVKAHDDLSEQFETFVEEVESGEKKSMKGKGAPGWGRNRKRS